MILTRAKILLLFKLTIFILMIFKLIFLIKNDCKNENKSISKDEFKENIHPLKQAIHRYSKVNS